jgi:hypothetical protein
LRQQALTQMRADESGAARHQCFHPRSSLTCAGSRVGRPPESTAT